MKFLQLVAETLAGPLTHILNCCIKTSHFPEAMKIVRVYPIPRVNHPKTEQDYCPISLLPVLQKVFERLVFNQVNEHIKLVLSDYFKTDDISQQSSSWDIYCHTLLVVYSLFRSMTSFQV